MLLYYFASLQKWLQISRERTSFLNVFAASVKRIKTVLQFCWTYINKHKLKKITIKHTDFQKDVIFLYLTRFVHPEKNVCLLWIANSEKILVGVTVWRLQ